MGISTKCSLRSFIETAPWRCCSLVDLLKSKGGDLDIQRPRWSLSTHANDRYRKPTKTTKKKKSRHKTRYSAGDTSKDALQSDNEGSRQRRNSMGVYGGGVGGIVHEYPYSESNATCGSSTRKRLPSFPGDRKGQS